MLCEIPFFDIESVVMTGVNFTTVPVGTVVVVVLPKPIQKKINSNISLVIYYRHYRLSPLINMP
jgi:hypothetical protein